MNFVKQRFRIIGLALVLSVFGAHGIADCCASAIEGVKKRHPVSVVEADIFVTKFSATVRLKTFAEDLELLQGVEALDDGFYDPEELQDAVKDHADFLAERIELIMADGAKVPASIVEISEFEIPEEGIRAGTLMQHTLGFVLEYKFPEVPEFITINQRLVGEGLILPSELKILLKQHGSDQPYMCMMKPDKPETFRFDWENPVLKSDASEEDWEKWFDDQRQKTLGIQSYSSIYSFVYIENYEVRHEILVPLATLTTLIDVDRSDPGFLEIPEQDAAVEAIKDFFDGANPVEIDGVVVQPVFDRIDFYGLDLRDFAVQAERKKISMANGRVGIIMSYSTKGMPQNVKVTWDRFNDVVKSVDSIIFAFEKIEKTEFTMFLEDNTYEWNADDREPPAPIVVVAADVEKFAPKMMAVPVISIGAGFAALVAFLICVFANGKRGLYLVLGAACSIAGVLTLGVGIQQYENPFAERHKISDENATQVFAQLHKNIFRAFDYPSEDEIYDALEKSVDGKLLRELYLSIIESLKVKEQGGAVSRIDEVRLVTGSVGSDDARENESERAVFGYRSTWDLVGTVEHWGHIHQRTNRYDADFQIELVGNQWKITQFQVINQEQGVVKTDLRKF